MKHIHRRLLPLVFAAAVVAVCAGSAQSGDALDLLRGRDGADANTVNIHYTRIRFEKILADLERNNPGMNVEVKADTRAEEQSLLATPVTMGPLVGVSWDAGLKYVADRMGLLIDRSQAAEGVVYLEKAARFTDSFDGMPLGEAVREIARRGNANVLFSAAMRDLVSTPVTLSFVDVPWRAALESVLKAFNCAILFDADAGIMRISTLSEADARMETRSRPLRYAQPEGSRFQAEIVKAGHQEFVGRKGVASPEAGKSLLSVLETIRSEAGRVTYESRTNTLILRDTPLKIQEMLRLVDEIDVPPQQVLIETRMVFMEEEPASGAGVKWRPADAGDCNDVSGGAYRLGTMSPANLTFLARAAAMDDRISITQSPQILVLDNEEASVFIGNVMRYALIHETADEGVSSSFIEERELPVGVQLFVIPHVCRGTDQVILEIIPKQTDSPEFTTIEVDGNEMQIPGNIRVKTVHTKMMLRSMETGVIAGLFRDELSDRIRKVPGLSKIPVLGKLFRHEEKRVARQNTMILVTPTIVPPKHGEEFDRDVEDLRASLASSL